MNSLIVFLCVGVVATLAAQLPENERLKLKQVHDSCQADPATYVDEDVLRQLHKNVDHKQAGVHMLCMSVKAGLQKQNGDFLKAYIKEKLATVVDDKSTLDGLVAKCAVRKETAEKSAVLLWLCFVQNNAPYIHKL